MRVRTALLILAALAASPALGSEIACKHPATGLPCAYQLETVALTPVPGRLKLQARVSLAKLPVGSGILPLVEVRITAGTAKPCAEKFTNVRVEGSVMNLLIGEHLSCNLESVVGATGDAMSLELCFDESETCTPPIELASAPYAMKVARAQTARHAGTADRAAQAHYAMRFAADRDLGTRRRIGAGTVDILSPAPSEAAGIYSAADWEPYLDTGLIAWNPARGSGSKRSLHIVGRSHATDRLAWLDELVVEATLTRVVGTLTVGADMTTHRLTVAGAVDTAAAGVMTTFSGPTHVVGFLTTTGDTTVQGAMTVDRGSSFHDLTVHHGATLEQTLTVSSAATLGGSFYAVTGHGNATIAGTLTVTEGTTTFSSTGGSGHTFTGDLTATTLSGASLGTNSALEVGNPGSSFRMFRDVNDGRLQYAGHDHLRVGPAGALLSGTLKDAIDAANGGAGVSLGMLELSAPGTGVPLTVNMLTSFGFVPSTGTSDGDLAHAFVESDGYWIAQGHALCDFNTSTLSSNHRVCNTTSGLPDGALVVVGNLDDGFSATDTGLGVVATVRNFNRDAVVTARNVDRTQRVVSGRTLSFLKSLSFHVWLTDNAATSETAAIEYVIIHSWKAQ